MPLLVQLHGRLNQVLDQHKTLVAVFDEFANFFKDCTQTPSISNHNITVALHLNHGFFTATFAGRTVSFVFTSYIEDSTSENLIGNVKCYLKQDFPEPKQIEFGGFTFNKAGQTNIKIPNSEETIFITNDLGTLLMALHFIHESLVK